MTTKELIEKIKQASITVNLCGKDFDGDTKVEIRMIPEEAWQKLCKEVNDDTV